MLLNLYNNLYRRSYFTETLLLIQYYSCARTCASRCTVRMCTAARATRCSCIWTNWRADTERVHAGVHSRHETAQTLTPPCRTATTAQTPSEQGAPATSTKATFLYLCCNLLAARIYHKNTGLSCSKSNFFAYLLILGLDVLVHDH